MADITSFHSSIVERPITKWFTDTLVSTTENLSSMLLHMQVGRMKSALNQLSNAQLEQIGITRDQIDAHAERLMGV